jgi:catechol 2,3-dioxygenase-like lactoylglutathione lyase family enzyme
MGEMEDANMPSGIDHLMINANDYHKAVGFYGWLMPRIGYPQSITFNEPASMTGYYGDYGSLWVVASEPTRRGETFDKGRVGLREIAFRAESRQQIDDLARDISSHGGRILDLPREYDYRPGYYSVFFTDPDGLKLEVVHYAK